MTMLAIPNENSLARFQRSFAEAIFFDAAAIPAAIEATPSVASRFGVYRNNVMAGLLNAVAARYPVVRKLLWDDTFDRAARLYVAAEPPSSPVLLEYGATFPAFLRRIGEGPSADYVADIAELESARTRAYHAADADALGHNAFATVSADELLGMRLQLHPSVTLIKSKFPIVSIWQANLNDNDNAVREWSGECALVARIGWQVEVRCLPEGTYEFLKSISDGETVGSSIAGAAAKVVEVDLAHGIATLIGAGIVVGMAAAEEGRPA